MRIKQLRDIANTRVFFVGIKGTGMSGLAEVFLSLGATVAGSDSDETFYTDARLHDLNIPLYHLDDTESIRKPYDFVVHSAAYNHQTQLQLQYFQAHGIPVYTYPQILGELSKQTFSVAVAGVHGKTTISGMSATMARELSLDGLCIVGGQVRSLSDRSVYIHGNQFLLAETCEYRRHFLNFHPNILVISNIELDHQDYFTDNADICLAFREFAEQIRPNGALIYCDDDKKASQLAKEMITLRNDVRLVPYGRSTDGEFRITHEEVGKSGMKFSIKKWAGVDIDVPLFGTHIVSNAAASLAIIDTMQQMLYKTDLDIQNASLALGKYSGAKRRMETVGIAREVTIIDDYAHHPTAIKATLSALRMSRRYKRIIVDFMPHTYSRTLALLDEFAVSFFDADIVITHQIYASARETSEKTITGEDFAAAIRKQHRHVHYFHQPMSAKQFCLQTLADGDVFITLGAGDNWRLGHAVYAELTVLVEAER